MALPWYGLIGSSKAALESMVRHLTLEVGEPKRDREHGNRRRADRRADDHVVEVESDLNGDVDDEHIHAERRHLADE